MLDAPSPVSPDQPESAPLPQLRRELRGWTRDLAVALGLALVIIIFLYQPVKVEGTSMAPLLSDQERIFINKFVYRFEPIERGDVVVFWYPLDRSKSFIKRVIGLPGETVEIRSGQLLRERQGTAGAVRSRELSRWLELSAAAHSGGRIFRDGRPSRQLERFARVRSGAAAVYLRQGRIRVLAGGSFWIADFVLNG